jgi:hypothetical protein
MNTFISANLKRTSERIDPSGNVIDPRTKQIVQPIAEEYVAPPEAPQAPTPTVNTQSGTLSIQEQIDEAKAKLAQLEELKKLKIQQMKAELELLEQ